MSKIVVPALALLFLVAPFGLSAHADTIVQNRDEPGRNRYVAHATISPTCGTNGCPAAFPAIPANENVVVQYVSCWILTQSIFTPSPIIPYLVFLDGHASNGLARAYVPAVNQGTLGTFTSSFVVSAQVVFYFTDGDKPMVNVLFNGNIGSTSPGDCTLTGYHVQLP